MNYILLFCVILAMINGVVQGLADMQNARQNPNLGVKASKNIFTFLFSDQY